MKLHLQALIPYGRLYLEEGRLFLNGTLVTDNQIIVVQYGEGELLPGRAVFHQETGWDLACGEFTGHSYLDIPLTEEFLSDLAVVAIAST